jgi:hypothetical protein
LEDTFHILHDIAIPKSQNNEALLTQPRVTFSIVLPFIRMLTAVNLDNQSFFETNKIYNVIA